MASAGPYAKLHLTVDNHASTPPLKVFYRPDALPSAKPTVSEHFKQQNSYKADNTLQHIDIQAMY